MKALDPFPRFIANIAPQPNGCWHWTGRIKENGYTQMSVNAKIVPLHRWSYEFFVGPIPAGMEIDHLCHAHDSCHGGRTCLHRRCLNPDHLAPASHAENTLRGVGVPAQNKRKTHCKRGHAFDEHNTLVNARGHRDCRICHALRALRRYHALRGMA